MWEEAICARDFKVETNQPKLASGGFRWYSDTVYFVWR